MKSVLGRPIERGWSKRRVQFLATLAYQTPVVLSGCACNHSSSSAPGGERAQQPKGRLEPAHVFRRRPEAARLDKPRQVNEQLGRNVRHHSRALEQIGTMPADAVAALRQIACRHRMHLVARGQQVADYVLADESGRPGEQHPTHGTKSG